MCVLDYIKENIVYLDGGMGTLLQARGLAPGERPERWNLTHPEVIVALQNAYYDAGSNIVCANTFGANTLSFSLEELDLIIGAAIANAKKAQKNSKSDAPKFVALDIGPTGKLLKPLGTLSFEDAVAVFAETVKLGVKHGADLIVIETMNDSYETKAALLAAKEHSDLPTIVTNAYSEDGKLMTGATPAAMVAMLEGMGADAIGANCSLGPTQLSAVMRELLACASVPVVMKPNAGLPCCVDGKTVYDVSISEFADCVGGLVEEGVRIVGGCCGTTPDYIEELVSRTQNCVPKPIVKRNETVISSYAQAVSFGKKPILIGERINPTGKKRFKQALLERDITYILSEGVAQAEKGAHVLDVNVGMPGIVEAELLPEIVSELQAILDLPLQIDTSDVVAMEAALRCYNGKALINSVNGKQENMEAIFPLVQKYGGVVVALTLDENGIPGTMEGRMAIAKKILETAASYGIDGKDIIFDTLTMAISADSNAANVTLGALRQVREQLKCHTILGVSNVSFGLPNRDILNGAFFMMALENGLSAAIINPNSPEMQKAYYAYCALKGLDTNCRDYLSVAESLAFVEPQSDMALAKKAETGESLSALQIAIVKGMKEQAAAVTAQALHAGVDPFSIVQAEIIPALNVVGNRFAEKTMYLPQLLMSAEAAKYASEELKKHLLASGAKDEQGATFVIATVQGDVHDIGKNIVKLLLENYGFHVVDLGKDVAPEQIVSEVIALHAPFVGLSALMTTTVPAMEKTIKKLRVQAPWCKILVGGAVLTKDYAAQIGADHYAKDAMEAVKYVQDVIDNAK